jgi:NADH-quinone oxidoreductase subunit C
MLDDLLPRLSGFDLIDPVERHPRLAFVRVPKAQLFSLLGQLKQSLGFVTLQTIACADWIEDGVFRLTYLLETAARDRALGVQTDIGREGEAIETAIPLWPQAEIFERELHEMFGIPIVGHPSLGDFMLEGWSHTPPMRREFDTLKFVQEQFEMRPDARTTRTCARRSGGARRPRSRRLAATHPSPRPGRNRRPWRNRLSADEPVAQDASTPTDSCAPEPGATPESGGAS